MLLKAIFTLSLVRIQNIPPETFLLFQTVGAFRVILKNDFFTKQFFIASVFSGHQVYYFQIQQWGKLGRGNPESSLMCLLKCA